MPKFTIEQIESELEALENSEAQAARFYLKAELKRRKNAGLKPSGKPVMTVAERVRKHRQGKSRK